METSNVLSMIVSRDTQDRAYFIGSIPARRSPDNMFEVEELNVEEFLRVCWKLNRDVVPENGDHGPPYIIRMCTGTNMRSQHLVIKVGVHPKYLQQVSSSFAPMIDAWHEDLRNMIRRDTECVLVTERTATAAFEALKAEYWNRRQEEAVSTFVYIYPNSDGLFEGVMVITSAQRRLCYNQALFGACPNPPDLCPMYHVPNNELSSIARCMDVTLKPDIQTSTSTSTSTSSSNGATEDHQCIFIRFAMKDLSSSYLRLLQQEGQVEDRHSFMLWYPNDPEAVFKRFELTGIRLQANGKPIHLQWNQNRANHEKKPAANSYGGGGGRGRFRGGRRQF